VNFRLLVREEAKIHRSHERVFNGLVVGIYTMWFNSIVWLLCMHGCVHDKQPVLCSAGKGNSQGCVLAN
jgi:hypothetical protein